VRFFFLIACLVSCGAPRQPEPPHPVIRDAGKPSLRRARNLELGHGVVRDYAAAAEIYQRLCSDGAGDLTACRRWVTATFDGRGVDVDPRTLSPLASAMCERDDALGCVLALMLSGNDEPPEQLVQKSKRLIAAPCDAQHLTRCELDREPFRFFNQSGSVEHADHEFDHEGCTLGVLDACQRLQYAEGAEHDAAMRVLAKACDDGDAMSCQVIGKPIDAHELCAAHDFKACLALGCAGDEAAAKIAIAHLADHRDCNAIHHQGLKVSTGITPTQHLPFDSVEFRPLDRSPRTLDGYEIYNVGTAQIRLVIGAVYVYDEAGKQTDRIHFEARDVLEPGAGTILSLHGEGKTFEPCIEVIELDGNGSQLARCPIQKPLGVRWGDGRANVGLTISFPGIPLADEWENKLEPALAEPFERAHPGIHVRSVSGGDLILGSESTEPYWVAMWRAERGPLLELPLALESTSIVYHLDGVDDLRLSPTTLAGILSGQIKRWNDTAIARDNPGRPLPDVEVVVLQPANDRDDELRVTRYLTKEASKMWKLGERRTEPVFAGVKWTTTTAVAGEVKATPGAITYVGPGLADRQHLAVARLRNAHGDYVVPTLQDVSSGAYPLVSMRTLYVAVGQVDQATLDAVRQYVDWILDDGLSVFEQLGYARPAAAITQAARARVAQLAVRPAPPLAVTSSSEVTIRAKVARATRVVHYRYDSVIDFDRVSGRDGVVTVEHLQTAPQKYVLTARRDDGAVGAAIVDISKPGTIDVALALRPANDPHVVRVHVIDASHKPVANALVTVNSSISVPTDKHGDAAIDLPDRYFADVVAGGAGRASERVQIELPQRSPTTVMLSP
jgi:ABC-type phosphate transport system substrate-binding protein/TPR repeat protein